MPKSEKVKIGQSAGKSFAYLLGVYLGDGCVSKAGNKLVFRVNTIDRDFAEAIKTALGDLTDRPVPICQYAVPKSSKPNINLQCRCQELCEAFLRDTERKAAIPAYVWRWDRANRLAFIVGLMDSEGWVAANTVNPTNRRFFMGYKSCDPWVPEFVRLLASVGIMTGKVRTEKPRQEGYKTPMVFTVKMQSWIDSGARFNIARKQNRIDEWASAGAYERRAKFPRRLTSETTRPTPEGAMI